MIIIYNKNCSIKFRIIYNFLIFIHSIHLKTNCFFKIIFISCGSFSQKISYRTILIRQAEKSDNYVTTNNCKIEMNVLHCSLFKSWHSFNLHGYKYFTIKIKINSLPYNNRPFLF